MPRIRSPRPSRRAYVATAVALLLAAPPAHAAPTYTRMQGTSRGTGNYPFVSQTGRYVAWIGRADGTTTDQAWLYDRQRRTQTLVSVTPSGAPGSGRFERAEVSADGRYVVFESTAPDLVPGDRNGASDVFLRDVVARRTTRISVGPRGAEAKAASSWAHISADGRTVVFTSCTDLSAAKPPEHPSCEYLLQWRRTSPTRLRLLTSAASPRLLGVSLSATGRYVAFMSNASLTPDDTDDDPCREDVYWLDTATSSLVRVTKSVAGEPLVPGTCGIGDRTYATPQIDATGRYVAFGSRDNPGAVSTSAPAILVRDMQAGTLRTAVDSTDAVDLSTGDNDWALSGDGRHVVFVAAGIAGQTPAATYSAVFLKNLATGTVTRVSMPPADPTAPCVRADAPGCAEMAVTPVLSTDGKVVAFVTNVPIADGDASSTLDAYVWGQA